MNTDQKLLAAYIEFIASAKPCGTGYWGVTPACMVLDKVGADMSDQMEDGDLAESRSLGLP
jgi:hypothetical protein